ncbi:MAG: DUF305 domain-containing protein [Ilumatobacteraceae bacterium]
MFDDDATPFVADPLDGDPDSGHDGPDRHDGPDGPDGPDDDVIVLSWWQRPINVVALLVATALIAGMATWLVVDANAGEKTSAVDVGFLQDMRVHHEQAVDMAFRYLQLPDTDPALRTVARSIVFGQGIDIGRMIQLLRDMGAPEAAETDEAMAWMGMPTTQADMPGMATEDQLAELSAASGATADQLFAQLMVAHHEGGAHMAEVAADEAANPKVRSMAESMVEGQRGEIAELQRLVS